MNNPFGDLTKSLAQSVPFDELTKSLAQAVTRRAALKKFGVGLAAMALAAFGLANKTEAGQFCIPTGSRCKPNTPCCSRVCSNGTCVCAPSGSYGCLRSGDCCSGVCIHTF